jgi:hypothetical protein
LPDDPVEPCLPAALGRLPPQYRDVSARRRVSTEKRPARTSVATSIQVLGRGGRRVLRRVAIGRGTATRCIRSAQRPCKPDLADVVAGLRRACRRVARRARPATTLPPTAAATRGAFPGWHWCRASGSRGSASRRGARGGCSATDSAERAAPLGSLGTPTREEGGAGGSRLSRIEGLPAEASRHLRERASKPKGKRKAVY